MQLLFLLHIGTHVSDIYIVQMCPLHVHMLKNGTYGYIYVCKMFSVRTCVQHVLDTGVEHICNQCSVSEMVNRNPAPSHESSILYIFYIEV